MREHRLVPAVAAAVLPTPSRPPRRAPAVRRHRAIGGFDFFGTQNPDKPEPAADPTEDTDIDDAADANPNTAAVAAVAAGDDLADVVGDEAYAQHEQADADPSATPEVIDLTAHDETEQLDMSELRAQA